MVKEREKEKKKQPDYQQFRLSITPPRRPIVQLVTVLIQLIGVHIRRWLPVVDMHDIE